MARTDDRFLRRWSRLKQKDRRRKEQPAVEKESAAPEVADAKAPPPDLPDVDSLDKDSDFSVFLKDGVPEELKRLALRKLWRTDPVFAVIDGLDDYDEDYRTAMVVAEKLAKRLKKARKGKADKAAEANKADKAAEAKKQGDEPPAGDRDEALAQTPREDQEKASSGVADKTSSGVADKKGGRATEPKRGDDAETG